MRARKGRVAAYAVVVLVCVTLGGCGGRHGPTSTDGTSSRDEGTIAYLANEGGFWQVWVVDPSGKPARQVTNSEKEKARLSWFPDGNRVLVHAISGELFSVDIQTGVETKLEGILLNGHDAVISPNGGRLVGSSSLTETPDTNQIVVIDLGPGRTRRILPAASGMQHQPAWSADEEWIYFLVPTASKRENNIWRVKTTEGVVEQLTVNSAYHLDVAVSKDGELAFSSNRSGDYEIWRWDVSGSREPVQVTDSPGLDGEVAWSPDGTSLVFSTIRAGHVPNLWRLDTVGSAPIQITRHKGGARSPAWWGHVHARP